MTQSLPEMLRANVRFLGRILGDVIRAEDGDEIFGQIEAIRQASVGFHRKGARSSAELMADRLGALSLPDTVRFAHSFACFLQITNIAEDQIQRRRGRAGDARPDPLAGAVRAKIMVLVFIVVFIQKRPQGLFAMKGRSAEA